MDCSMPGFLVLHQRSPGVCSNSCPLSRWCPPTVSSSVTPLLLLPSVFPSSKVFSKEFVLHIRWPKYWGFGFRISPSSEYPGLISFRIDWFDLLAVQGTLRSLLQHHNAKASILLLSLEPLITYFSTQKELNKYLFNYQIPCNLIFNLSAFIWPETQ